MTKSPKQQSQIDEMGLEIDKWKLQGRPQMEISLTYLAPESESGKVLGILHGVLQPIGAEASRT